MIGKNYELTSDAPNLIFKVAHQSILRFDAEGLIYFESATFRRLRQYLCARIKVEQFVLADVTIALDCTKGANLCRNFRYFFVYFYHHGYQEAIVFE